MKKRSEVDIKETWNINHIFEDDKAFDEALLRIEKLVDDFKEKYEGNIKTAEDINRSFDDIKEIFELLVKIENFAMLQVEADMLNDDNTKRAHKADSVVAKILSKLSFHEIEIASLDKDILLEASKNEENRRSIEKVIKKKPHYLSKEVEETLSSLMNTLNYPYQGYNDTKFKDIRFPDVISKGKKYPMTYNSFEGHMEYEIDTDLRREAFKVFSDTLRKYENTTASQYNAQVQMEKTISEIRGYDSVFDYLLEDQEVSLDLYNRQIDVIMKELPKKMKKYVELIKEVHNLDEVRYSDLKIEIDPSYSPDVSYEEARKYITEGLSILGPDYVDMLNKAFDERWIDYSENLGKRTGAFCSSVYGVHPYVMLSFNKKMSEVMTLSHELGHAGNAWLEEKEQNILNTDASRYIIEAPSTTNELILENYLLDKAEEKNDLRMKRWVLSQMISKTYYHNFITHLLEASFQREVYKLVDKGQVVNANILNDIYREKLEEFWGDSVILDPGAELTWMRQPHYYMGLYPYTYSASLTIGTQVARNIRKVGRKASENWKNVMKLGGSKSPEELAKLAGVDISTDKPLKDTIEYIGSLVDEIVDITKKLK